ncbi:hypothetical protein GXV27_003040 [Escherichia coli]|nr:hypothetical protein [Escherichia coli]
MLYIKSTDCSLESQPPNTHPASVPGFLCPTFAHLKTHNRLYLLKNKQIQLTKTRNSDPPQVCLFLLINSCNQIKNHNNQQDI